MRRHAKASPARSKARKPSGHGSSPPSGRLRLAILLATVAAFLLVPVAQAAAFTPGEIEVELAGTGTGEVTSLHGMARVLGEEGRFEGTPAIQCSKGSPETGPCKTTMSDYGGEAGVIIMEAIADPGSVVAPPWSVGPGEPAGGCEGPETEGPPEFIGRFFCLVYAEEETDAKVAVTFDKAFTVKKALAGEGTVVGANSGIECLPASTSCSAAYEGAETLTASPAAGYAFKGWSVMVGAVKSACTTTEGRKCMLTATATTTVTASFTPTYSVTVTKDGSTGLGKVKGVTCEESCTSATGSFAVGKTVTLEPTAAKIGSTFTEWSSCPGTIEGNNCKMSAAGTAEAKFTAIPKLSLTVNKSGGGQGTVKSKPAGINCGTTCPTAKALLYEGTPVVLTASVMSGKGSTLGTWSGGGCSGTEAVPCTVPMSVAATVTAEFK